MTAFRVLRAFPLLGLVLGVACADTPAPTAGADGRLGDDTDNAVGDDAEDDSTDSTLIDAGKATTSKPDAGGKTTAKPDAATVTNEPKTPAASVGDAGIKSDASVAQADAGEPLPASALKPKCMKKDSQLIEIGDSYINWSSHTFPADMAKESGQKWRMEAVGGYSMGSGGLGLIPPEFDAAIKKDPDAHTILMDGGGNDVLLADPTLDLFGECQQTGSSTKPNCQKIVQMAIDAADKLMQRMTAAGIRDIVYFFYPHVPANTIISGPNPNEILDYSLPMTRAFCEGREAKSGGKTRCTFVDMVPVFEGHKDWFNTDIHPNSKGSAGMAKKIWEVMSAKCLGQKSGADCCEE